MKETYYMKCSFCESIFAENQIQESHDVPCYLFWDKGTRREQKNEADKWGRTYLCKRCHNIYEEALREHLKNVARDYARKYFKKEEDKKDGDPNTII